MSWSIESGYSHHCSDCNTTWTDSDGGCECVSCQNCHKMFGHDSLLNEDGLCPDCAEDEPDEDDVCTCFICGKTVDNEDALDGDGRCAKCAEEN